MVTKTKSKTKPLSEMLVDQAQWWMKTDDYADHSLWHLAATQVCDAMNMPLSPKLSLKYWNEARAYACLLEAQYQKDIESGEES